MSTKLRWIAIFNTFHSAKHFASDPIKQRNERTRRQFLKAVTICQMWSAGIKWGVRSYVRRLRETYLDSSHRLLDSRWKFRKITLVSDFPQSDIILPRLSLLMRSSVTTIIPTNGCVQQRKLINSTYVYNSTYLLVSL